MAKRIAKQKLLRIGYIVVLLWPCFEVACWIIGARPFKQEAYEIVSEPENCIIADSLQGFALRPGAYTVRINKGLSYKVRHNSFGRRSMPDAQDSIRKGTLSFFGCSYTYGMGVNDHETFPSLVAEQFPALKIENHAVPGFGTVQGLLQLKAMIEDGKAPDVVVFCYAGFHDQRNSMSPYYRRDLRLGYLSSSELIQEEMGSSRFPYATMQESNTNVKHLYWNDVGVWERLRMHLASVNLVLSVKEQIAEQSLPMKEVTQMLFCELKTLCDENNIEILVFGVMSNGYTKHTLEELTMHGIPTLCTEVELSDPKFNNMPFDSHPNDTAHELMATELQGFLSVHIAK